MFKEEPGLQKQMSLTQRELKNLCSLRLTTHPRPSTSSGQASAVPFFLADG